MSWTHLGETFDIHGGGIDLVFPHHENEIAQSTCAFGHGTMANYWMHNGFLQVEGQKMSKSLGNFVTINELLTTDRFGGRPWPGEVLRLAMLKTHYRQPIDWTVAGLRESQRELDRWYPIAKQFAESDAILAPEFAEALEDDLNTPDAITILRRLYKEAAEDVAFAGARFASGGHLLGLFQKSLGEWNHWKPADLEIDEIFVAHKIKERLDARKAKDWAASDRIRDELADMGVALKDNKDGTTSWEVKR
jgi:cysteinyl-tRNA synthetase